MVSNMFYFHPYLGKIPIVTNIFQMGWNHQLDKPFAPKGKENSLASIIFHVLQGGPLLVMNEVISVLIGVMTPFTTGFWAHLVG